MSRCFVVATLVCVVGYTLAFLATAASGNVVGALFLLLFVVGSVLCLLAALSDTD